MNWKTCSVEAGGGISKRGGNRADEAAVHAELAVSKRPLTGMQKHGLTMFATTCYSSLVPRVHPGLLCAVSFFRAMCTEEFAVEL